MATIDKKWWQSSNFWTALVLLAGGFFVGFPEDAGKELVGLLFALVAIGKTLHNYIKTAVPKLKEWILDANFWNYFLAIVISIFPTFNPAIMDSIEAILRGVINQNWQGVIMAVFSLATIIYKIFTTKPV